MSVQLMFPQSFYANTLSINVESLKKLCYDIKNNDTGRIISNSGGWQSNDIVDLDNINIKMLLSEINIHINKFSKELGIIPELSVSNFWININNTGSTNTNHVHPKSILSGSFYVDVPENSGDIVFIHPIGNLMESYLQYWNLNFGEDIKTDSIFLNTKWQIHTNPNCLLIFPSWIEHKVTRNENTNDRISISFNTKPVYNEK